jgi:SRSO17 transposase
MDGHASPAALPALQECLGAFQVRFRRPAGREAPERDTTGLRTEWPHTHGDTIAQAVPGTRAQRVQAFLTHRPWEEADLNRQRVHQMIAEATPGDGVVGCDETGFPTPGRASVGVARQYAGTLGTGGHCQVAVTCGDTAPQTTTSAGSRRVCPPR